MCRYQIGSFEPDFVPFCKRCEVLPSSFHHEVLCMSDCFVCYPSEFLDVGAPFFKVWYEAGVKDLVCLGCESHDQFEWGFAGRIAGPRIMGVLCDWKPVAPIVLVSVGVYS